MTNVVGLFETRDQAHRAVEALKAAGLKAEDMSIVMRDRSTAEDVAQDAGAGSGDAVATGAMGGGVLGGVAGLLVGVGALAIPGIGPLLAAGPLAAALAGGALGATAGGLVGALVSSGVPEEEAGVYHTGVERGGILLTVKTTKKGEAEVRRLLAENGMKDANYHRSHWEQDPNFKYDIDRSTNMSASDKRTDDRDKAKVDAKAGGTAVGGTVGAVAGAALGGPVGAAIGAVAGAAIGGTTGAAVDYNEVEPRLREHWESTHKGKSKAASTWDQAAPAYKYAWESYDKPEHRGKSYDEVSTHLKSGWAGKGKWEETEPLVRGAWEARAQKLIDAGDEAVLPVVEEELHVGKRKVEKGGVKVSTRVTETPVEEQVHLHEEHVEVKRRPANRAATASDAAFREGTIELTESAEEAVVAKKAKVVEEVVVKKQGSTKAQTVKDTVRRTDVDVVEADAGHDAHDADFRTHHKAHYAKSGATYDEYAPAYRFGSEFAGSNPQHGEWAAVEPSARKAWEKQHKGTWEEFKDAVHHGWMKVTGQK